ncbi:MAG: zinc-binding dehydrogenase [Ideonella sp.]|nr:zinc-binding dehydrogenase [Ideonella sp.]
MASNTAQVADVVIDYSHEAVERRLSGYGVVLETLGGDVLHKSLGVLKPGGKLISIIRPIIDQVSAFDESPAALAQVASGRARGKVVIRVAPDIAQGGAKG